MIQDKRIDKNVLEEENEKTISYILKQEELFYDIAFRVMKNHGKTCFVKCRKLRYNGNIKLMYFIEDMISLENFFVNAKQNEIVSVINNLIKIIKQIEENGFLNIDFIDSRFYRIYVEKDSLTVRLIYLPLNNTTEEISNVKQDTDIYKRINKQLQERNIQYAYEEGTWSMENPYEGERGPIMLVSADGLKTIPITKEEFLIGKNPDKVDGIIEGNSAISRIHCKIIHSWNSKDYMMDMGSANGSYLNGVRVPSDDYIEINVGDRIKLANEEFIVRR